MILNTMIMEKRLMHKIVYFDMIAQKRLKCRFVESSKARHTAQYLEQCLHVEYVDLEIRTIALDPQLAFFLTRGYRKQSFRRNNHGRDTSNISVSVH